MEAPKNVWGKIVYCTVIATCVTLIVSLALVIIAGGIGLAIKAFQFMMSVL